MASSSRLVARSNVVICALKGYHFNCCHDKVIFEYMQFSLQRYTFVWTGTRTVFLLAGLLTLCFIYAFYQPGEYRK